MSFNLYLSAKLKDNATKIEEVTVEERFELWQTPTYITLAILEMENKVKGYIDWAKASNPSDTIHIQQLRNWLKKHKDWDIEWYYI